jgi:hypothetical protein
MKYNVDRMQVLSGIKSQDNVMVESTQDLVAEEKIRLIIREEIQAYLYEQKAHQMNKGFANQSVARTMGFAGPGFSQQDPPAHTAPRGPGRTMGFPGPGFM